VTLLDPLSDPQHSRPPSKTATWACLASLQPFRSCPWHRPTSCPS